MRLLGHPVFLPVYKLTQKLGISWYDFSKTITNIIQDKNFNGKFKELYNDFCKESHKELFDSMEEADAYYSTPKNYKLLLSGEAGESLASKYTVKGLLILDEILTTIFYVLRNKFNKSYDVKLKSILNSTEKWLKNIYWIDEIFKHENNIKVDNKYKLNLDFDFPEWLSKSHLPVEQFIKKSSYELDYNFEKIDYIRNELTSIFAKDKKRALASYFDRINLKFDFFEKRVVKLPV